jgi:AcrR family transcriptional regulator
MFTKLNLKPIQVFYFCENSAKILLMQKNSAPNLIPPKGPALATVTRPKQKRSMELCQAVLDATILSLEKNGYEKSTTNHIAELAGVSIGSLYRYFPNKHSIIKSLAQQVMDENRKLHCETLRSSKGMSLDEAITLMADKSLEHFLSKPKFFSIFITKVFEVNAHEIILENRKRIAGDMADIIINEFPEWGVSLTQQELQENLFQGFNAYIAILLATILAGSDPNTISRLRVNMINMFVGLVGVTPITSAPPSTLPGLES